MTKKLKGKKHLARADMVVFDGEKKFTLEILKYIHKSCSGFDYYVANFLMITMDAYDENYTWSVTDKYFEIKGLENLYIELKLERNTKEELFFEGTEGTELSFSYIPSEKLFKIIFNYKFHPKKARYQFGEDEEYEMGFYLNESQRNGLIKSIENILKMFPYR